MQDPTKRKVRMVHVPWDYWWNRNRCSQVRDLGIVELPAEMAEAAIREGVAERFPARKPAASRRPAGAAPAATGGEG